MSGQFIAHNSVLLLLQAAVVALPACGVPRWLARAAGRGWALVLPLSIAIVVGAIELFPAVADALTWVAFLLVPPGAALALGWAMHGARPPLAAIAVALFALAWAATGTLIGHSAAAVLTALSTVTLGRLLAGVVPGVWLKAGIVSMAIVDAVLVFGNQLQAPNAVLNAAIPAPGLPQLQYLNLHYASMGYGDVLVAGVLGGVLVCERTRQLPVALLVLVVAALWDLLFLVPSINTLPATVPVAIALILVELRRRLRLTMPAPIRRS